MDEKKRKNKKGKTKRKKDPGVLVEIKENSPDKQCPLERNVEQQKLREWMEDGVLR